MNTRSSTEVEVVVTDEIISPMIWTQLFLKAQGYPVKENILYQDKQQECRQALSYSQHLILLTDQKARGHIDIKYCPTDEMIRDYMTKPLHGAKFDGASVSR